MLIETSTAGKSSSAGSSTARPVKGLTPAAKPSRSGPEGRAVSLACGVGAGVAEGGGKLVLVGAGTLVLNGVGDSPGLGDVGRLAIPLAQVVVKIPHKSHSRARFSQPHEPRPGRQT